MNNLRDILYGVSLEEVRGNTDFEVNQLRFDSRQVQDGDVFFGCSISSASAPRLRYHKLMEGMRHIAARH